MVKYLGNPHSLFIITFIAFVVPCFCDPTDIISSCLIRHNVYNFTLLPHNGSQSPDTIAPQTFPFRICGMLSPLLQNQVAIAIPTELKQLVNSMRCCREGWYEFRVRCGGHSYEGISSVVPDGNPFVIIDMMSLNQVSVDVESETAWVEGGATLGETYYAVAEASNVHGFSAGSCPTVDGRVLDRKAMGEDVFWAIRGGGGGDWGDCLCMEDQVVESTETVTSCIMSRTRTKLHVAELVTSGNSSHPELGVEKEDCREMSWIESILYFSGLPNGSSISELRNRYLEDKLYFKAKSDYVRTPISMEGLVTALDILEMEPKGSVVLDPYGGEMEKISSDALPFSSQKRQPVLNSVYGGLGRRQHCYEQQGPRAAYVNYMDLDLGQMNSSISSNDPVEAARDWGEKYFLNNYDRLVKVKTCIDPDNVFNNQQGIPPMPTARLNNRSEGLGVSERCMVVSY
ncbi:Reticuline oxidase [Vitis vinifera]|uniref:Reticuline oxidase n=1 Tax=Vitis vinifera TaxID=29760 RepID=A0A438D8M9_VITVI|nr:Reticuline oxidase [Vitis vinifera]